MATISIGLLSAMTEPGAYVHQISEADTYSAGERFVVIRLGEDVTAIAPGFGLDAVRYARALAAALTSAADTIDAQIAVPVEA